MKALIWNKDKTIEIVEKEIPKIINDEDTIVKVTYSSICTSDLHIVEGFVPKAIEKTTLGHEFVGIIVKKGKNVKLKIGDRVAVNCESFCGKCFYCKKGYVNNCENGGWLLGCSIDGAASEYVRVPFSNQALTKIPKNVTDKNALFIGDILSTGFWSAKIAQPEKNDTIAILGAGPVGLCSALSLRYFGVKRIILIDINDFRLDIAKKEGLADFTINPYKKDVIEEILKLTQNKGADRVIEAAGAKNTFETAWKIARANSIVVIPAMYEENQILPLPLMYGKNLTFKTGGVDASCCKLLMKLIEKKKISTDFLITNEINFNDIIEGYQFFKNNKDKCLKIAVKY